MPNSIAFVFSIELALIMMTTFFLIGPSFLLQMIPPRLHPALKWVGLICLFLTFCWSVVLGVVMTMSDLL